MSRFDPFPWFLPEGALAGRYTKSGSAMSTHAGRVLAATNPGCAPPRRAGHPGTAPRSLLRWMVAQYIRSALLSLLAWLWCYGWSSQNGRPLTSLLAASQGLRTDEGPKVRRLLLDRGFRLLGARPQDVRELREPAPGFPARRLQGLARAGYQAASSPRSSACSRRPAGLPRGAA